MKEELSFENREALGRLYYACYYAVTALLIKHGISPATGIWSEWKRLRSSPYFLCLMKINKTCLGLRV